MYCQLPLISCFKKLMVLVLTEKNVCVNLKNWDLIIGVL